MRLVFALVLSSAATAGPALAQAAVATDLWRVAQGTLTRPAALAEGGTAIFWTPAVALDTSVQLRGGVESVHAPSETGVQSGSIAVAVRAGRLTLNAGYGRIGITDVAMTETSPEAVGEIPIWSQTAVLGVAFAPRAGLAVGAAMRLLGGRMGPSRRSQTGLDAGVRYRRGGLQLGFATQFLDPALGSGGRGTVYSLGGEYAVQRFDAWRVPATLAVRYGAGFQGGEGVQHLLLGAVTLGRMGVEWGMAREAAFGDPLWRSRFGVELGSGAYRFAIGRDGGANGFGATWRFGLTGEVR